MKQIYFLSAITLLSILTIFNVSCEKPEPEPEPPATPVEEPVVTTAERLVGKWARHWSYATSKDTLLFTEDGTCYCIIGDFYSNGSSDTTAYSYECSEQFLVFYNNNMEQYSPQPHYIKFYDDYTYFVMYNCPFFTVADVISNVGFKKVD
jgi:hypothetical protein